MTKRKATSPYKNPPSPYVRRLTQAGWRRCDAEALAVVDFCLSHAAEGSSLRAMARYAGAALEKAPVLAGAVMLFAGRPTTAESARLLAVAAPAGRGRIALLELGIRSAVLRVALDSGEDADARSA